MKRLHSGLVVACVLQLQRSVRTCVLIGPLCECVQVFDRQHVAFCLFLSRPSDEEESGAGRAGGRSLLLGGDVTVPHAGADAGGGASEHRGDA